jgi:hypothetical protein
MKQEREFKASQEELKEKIAARNFAKNYLSDLNASVFNTLEDSGTFYKRIRREEEELRDKIAALRRKNKEYFLKEYFLKYSPILFLLFFSFLSRAINKFLPRPPSLSLCPSVSASLSLSHSHSHSHSFIITQRPLLRSRSQRSFRTLPPVAHDTSFNEARWRYNVLRSH